MDGWMDSILKHRLLLLVAETETWTEQGRCSGITSPWYEQAIKDQAIYPFHVVPEKQQAEKWVSSDTISMSHCQGASCTHFAHTNTKHGGNWCLSVIGVKRESYLQIEEHCFFLHSLLHFFERANQNTEIECANRLCVNAGASVCPHLWRCARACQYASMCVS